MAERRNGRLSTYVPLDDIDRLILAELQADPRQRTSAIARKIGLSAPATKERLRRLEGSVVTYSAEVDPRAVGYPICALVRVSPNSIDLHRVPAEAEEIPEVTECYRVTGEDCYVLKLYLHAMDDLEPILDRFAHYGRTTTSIVHSVPIPRRPLPVGERRADSAE